MSDVRARCRALYGDVPCAEIVRSDGTLEAHECNETLAGLAMAAMKLNRDVSDWLESGEEGEPISRG